jgi:hypothetical protein
MATKVYVLGVTGPRRFSKHRVVAINRVEKRFTDNAADWKQKSVFRVVARGFAAREYRRFAVSARSRKKAQC